ncbi:uncharacterized protein BP5553_05199 [Venustampulla echinocandica]|uniref:Uncharacterized protein n=1 Tax=Venustampulla echinocandica TaxID=2656787 RepID=A0A370TQG5_9HELO|nr:uncharacterized protein BP5553_05199 [Venustampulla echinocandica]RDL37766.1 hypothetical protein BP5553_05199 [Venustampulla echinocandica]
MEHPVAGLSRPRGVRKNTALLNGGTSLKLSDGGLSPVLEAHPGSPVDISDHPRPSLAASLSQRLYHGSDAELAKFSEKRARLGRREDFVRRGGVAAKGITSVRDREMKEKENCRLPNRTMQVAGSQPFYIPAKITEQDEVPPGSPVAACARVSIDTDMDMQYDFKTEDGMWISANPLARESRSSLATTATATTYMTNSTMMDDRMSYSAMTADTSVASSAASMMSSIGSIRSSMTGSSDMYGWEEELERQETIESEPHWNRRSSGRGPQFRSRKKKGLLYRVLNMSSSRRGSTELPPMQSIPGSINNGYPAAST